MVKHQQLAVWADGHLLLVSAKRQIPMLYVVFSLCDVDPDHSRPVLVAKLRTPMHRLLAAGHLLQDGQRRMARRLPGQVRVERPQGGLEMAAEHLHLVSLTEGRRLLGQVPAVARRPTPMPMAEVGHLHRRYMVNNQTLAPPGYALQSSPQAID